MNNSLTFELKSILTVRGKILHCVTYINTYRECEQSTELPGFAVPAWSSRDAVAGLDQDRLAVAPEEIPLAKALDKARALGDGVDKHELVFDALLCPLQSPLHPAPASAPPAPRAPPPPPPRASLG